MARRLLSGIVCLILAAPQYAFFPSFNKTKDVNALPQKLPHHTSILQTADICQVHILNFAPSPWTLMSGQRGLIVCLFEAVWLKCIRVKV